MLGAPPALANTRFPVASSDVIGREPPEARATDRPQTGRKGSVNASSREAEARPACWGLLRPARGCGPRASPACRRGTCFTVLTEATPRGWGTQDHVRAAHRPEPRSYLNSQLLSFTLERLLEPTVLLLMKTADFQQPPLKRQTSYGD